KSFSTGSFFRKKVFSKKKKCMNATVRRSRIKGEIIAPPSKSYTHRAIAIASLGEKSDIFYPLISEDTKATINAAKCLGAVVEYDEKTRKITIEGTEGKPRTPEDVINAENSGTTLRFFTAISSLCDGAVVLTGDASLRKRPNSPLLKSLNDLGSEAFSTKGDGTAPIVVKGRLKGGETTMDASISSQFISALLIACPLAENNSYIVTNNLTSVPYMRMTTEVLEKAGVEVPFSRSSNNHYYFQVEGGKRYELRRFTVPGDFSSSSYLLAAAALTDSEVKISNLFPSAQGDSRIVEILNEMGADIRWDKEKGIVEVKGAKDAELKGIEVDMRENPDLVPTIAVLGVVAKGTTEITGVAHLRYKETDRLRFLTEELRKMGARIEEKEEGLLIEGRKRKELKAAKVYSHDDHRLAMALCIAALSASGETDIEGAECAEVSYPSFFRDIRNLGADIKLS
ncbi:MAG: 3-phosphoshikimate 1-carboxyvinyltransferase, partial [Methanophagales archaeon]|nr:3-phosphoshikimate 1-carboxyvinyltransferase [Methanophagales archaeon]